MKIGGMGVTFVLAIALCLVAICFDHHYKNYRYMTREQQVAAMDYCRAKGYAPEEVFEPGKDGREIDVRCGTYRIEKNDCTTVTTSATTNGNYIYKETPCHQ